MNNALSMQIFLTFNFNSRSSIYYSIVNIRFNKCSSTNSNIIARTIPSYQRSISNSFTFWSGKIRANQFTFKEFFGFSIVQFNITMFSNSNRANVTIIFN